MMNFFLLVPLLFDQDTAGILLRVLLAAVTAILGLKAEFLYSGHSGNTQDLLRAPSKRSSLIPRDQQRKP
jgi:hypothetical protein